MGGIGSGGQNRKTDEEKRRQGTWRADRSNPDAPTVTVVPVPGPPEQLSASERQIWAAYKHDVDALKVYAESNLQSFVRMVKAAVLVDRLEREDPVNHGSLDKAERSLKAWHAAFGLTPVDRSKIRQLPESEGARPDDVLGEWFS